MNKLFLGAGFVFAALLGSFEAFSQTAIEAAIRQHNAGPDHPVGSGKPTMFINDVSALSNVLKENIIYADTRTIPEVDWGIQRRIEDDEETPTRHSLGSTTDREILFGSEHCVKK